MDESFPTGEDQHGDQLHQQAPPHMSTATIRLWYVLLMPPLWFMVPDAAMEINKEEVPPPPLKWSKVEATKDVWGGSSLHPGRV